MKIMSIDPSSYTGFAVLDLPSLDPDKPEIRLKHLSEYELPKSPDLIERLFYLGHHLEKMIGIWEPDHVFIEGYSFGSRYNHELMYGIGTAFRMFLRQNNIGYEETPPTSVKKFVTGKGQGKKQLMLMKVLDNWGFPIENDNMADAFAISVYGAFKLLGYTDEKGNVARTTIKEVPVHSDININQT